MNHNPADIPRPGYFKTKLVRNGPWLGARVFKTLCTCTINGGDESLEHDWNLLCDRYPNPTLSAELDGKPAQFYRVWTTGTEIDETEFNYLTGISKWDRQNDAFSPYVTPHQPININKTKPVGP